MSDVEEPQIAMDSQGIRMVGNSNDELSALHQSGMTKSRSRVNVLQRVTAKEGRFSVGGSEIEQSPLSMKDTRNSGKTKTFLGGQSVRGPKEILWIAGLPCTGKTFVGDYL